MKFDLMDYICFGVLFIVLVINLIELYNLIFK